MAVRFIERVASGASRVANILRHMGGSNVVPLVLDADDEKLKFYDRTNSQTRIVQDGKRVIETLITARTLTMEDSGKIFFLALADGFTVTLPAAADAAGFEAEFIVTIAPTTAYIVQTAGAPEQKLQGLVHSSTGGDADSETDITGTNINFVAATAVIGDRARVLGNGSGFFSLCHCNADGGITITG
jgi:hypothetical protein